MDIKKERVNFKAWFKNDYEFSVNVSDEIIDYMTNAWLAAKQSAQKEIEDLKKDYLNAHERKCELMQENINLKLENEKLKKSEMTEELAISIRSKMEYKEDDFGHIEIFQECTVEQLKAIVFLMENKKEQYDERK